MGVLRNIINFDELMAIMSDAWKGATQTPSETTSAQVQGFCLTKESPTTWQPGVDCIVEGVYISASTWDKVSATDRLHITVNDETFIHKSLMMEPQYFETAKTIDSNSVVSLLVDSEFVRHVYIDIHYKQLPEKGGTNL